ncbi:MAG: helix-turn-helix domain-containing protein [Bacteroidota bacterium]
MSFAFLDIVVLFGIILSLFLVILILSSKSFRSDIHKYFAATIISLNFCLTYTWFEAYVPSNGIMEIISWDFLFPFAFMMYTLKAIKHPLSNSKKIWLLAIPCLFLSFFQSIDFFFDFDLYDWLTNGNEEKMLMLIEIRVFSFLPFSIVLIGFSYSKIRNASNMYKQEKKWLAFNSLAILSFLISWLFSDPIASFFDFAIWEYLLAVLALFLVIVTYLGVHHLNISEQRRHIKELQISSFSNHNLVIVKEKAIDINKENEHISISQKKEEKIQKLDTLMTEDRLYLNPSLSRTIVAEKLGISDGYLSELIKNVLKTNFNDYVNEFRVNHVIQMFHDKKFDVFSIEAIGLEAGFKTKSVYYNAFKKVTKQTPGAYQRGLNLS